MKAFESKDIRGNWATILLPVNRDESIDFGRLESEMDRLISIRPSGMYCNGTAGEFYNITEEEFDHIAALVAFKCNASGIPFQIGVSHMSPKISLERLKRSITLKPGAFQVILPDWYVPTQQEAIDFMTGMADAAGEIGLVLYNPPHAKWTLSPAELLILHRRVPQILGVKVADGDQAWYEGMIPLAHVTSVFIPGHRIASARSKGVGHGAYSNMACLNPKAAQLWWDSLETDMDAALELEGRVLDFLEAYILPFIQKQGYSNQAVDKFLAVLGAWADIGSTLRWPYKSIPEDEATGLRRIARNMIPEFFIGL